MTHADEWNRFAGLCERLGIAWTRTPQGWADVLIGMYSAEGRHYHGLRHINNLLDRLRALTPFSGPGLDRFLEAETAIWFHDAVYTIGSDVNEEASAHLARSFLWSVGLGSKDPNGLRTFTFTDDVDEAIMATKHTGKEPRGNGARLMVDLDLAGFADPWDEFEENNRLIRAEYASVPRRRLPLAPGGVPGGTIEEADLHGPHPPRGAGPREHQAARAGPNEGMIERRKNKGER